MSGDERLFTLENLRGLNRSTLYFLLSTLYWPSANRGWRTRIELFVDGMGDWGDGVSQMLQYS